MKKRIFTLEHRKKLSESRMGKSPWNKGTKGIMKSNKTSFKKGDKIRLGMKHSEEFKRKRSEILKGKTLNTGRTHFKKGHEPWNKDKLLSEETKIKISQAKKGQRNSINTEFKKGQFEDEKHLLWKGDEAGYSAIHKWLIRKLGQPRKCDGCGTTEAKRFEWANISGEYKRDFDDWKRLCKKCHAKFDKIGEKVSIAFKIKQNLWQEI